MPSVENEMPEKKDLFNVAAADMEELVAAIKHNLRLKSRTCHSLCSKQKRVSPYEVPTTGRTCKRRSGKDSNCQQSGSCLCVNSNKKTAMTDDPYEMLQVLLREGSLIKEAVKRLQLMGGQENPGNSSATSLKKKESIDFYEHECSICDLPATNMTRTIEL